MARYVFVNRYFHPDVSATSQLLSDLAFTLAAKGDQVLVVTSRDRYALVDASPLPARESVHGVDVVRLRTPRCARFGLIGRAVDCLWFYGAVLATLLRRVRSDHIVIAKTDPPLVAVVAAIACAVRGATFVNWLQDLFPEVACQLGVPGSHRLSSVLLALRDWSLRRARVNVVLGQRMRDVVRSRGIAPERIEVLANWAEAHVAPVVPAANALRTAWGFTSDHVVLGYSGNMGRAHDLETFVAAAIRLKDHPRLRFLFIGGGAKRALVETAVARHRLANVTLQNYQPREQLAESLSVPDVHLVSLLPELEGLVVPSKLYGAMAAGRSVINVGAQDGEVAQLLRHSGAGWSCRPGDVEQLVTTIEAMLQGDDFLACGEAAQRFSMAHLRRDVALRRWTTMLASLAEQPEIDGGNASPVVSDELVQRTMAA